MRVCLLMVAWFSLLGIAGPPCLKVIAAEKPAVEQPTESKMISK